MGRSVNVPSSAIAVAGRIILENSHAQVVLSEYGGLASVAIVAKDDVHGNTSNLAIGWCHRIAGNFHAHIAKRYPSQALKRIATASNGESFYERLRA